VMMNFHSTKFLNNITLSKEIGYCMCDAFDTAAGTM
jgi:hypothetical protein